MVDTGRPRGRAETWRPWIGAVRRPVLTWPSGIAGTARSNAERLRTWALADVAPGRLVPWLAVAFGCGVVLYFTAEQEPALWAAVGLALATSAAAVIARRRPVAFPAAIAIAAIAAGFAAATVKRAVIAHPVLAAPAFGVDIAGFVAVREERERSDRIVVRVVRIEGARLAEKLERVRVAVRKGTAPAVGSFVEPMTPSRAGGLMGNRQRRL